MSHHETEALDYPSAHRDRVLDLLLRRESLTAALAGAPASGDTAKRSRWAHITCWIVVALVVLISVASVTGIGEGNGPQMVNLILIAVALIALITVVKSNQNSARRDRLTLALEMTRFQLDQLRGDYTTAEREALYSDLTTLDRLEPGFTEASNKVTLTFATIGLVIVAVVFISMATDMMA